MAIYTEDKSAIKRIKASDLKVDTTYQRKLSSQEVKAIVKNFDFRIVSVVKVSYRDGEYYIYDGQHTVAALMALFGQDVLVNCSVLYDLTLEQEAELFVKQTGKETKPLKATDIFKADLARGEKSTSRINEICSNHGIRIYLNGGSVIDGTTTSVRALKTIYEKIGEELFEKTITVISSAWKLDKDSLTSKSIKMVSEFVRLYHNEADWRIAINKWGKKSIKEIIAAADASIISGNKKYPATLLALYNSGLDSSKKLPDKF